jgi:hypothetical protein
MKQAWRGKAGKEKRYLDKTRIRTCYTKLHEKSIPVIQETCYTVVNL